LTENNTLVMVVDDEPTMCRILDRILTGEGYNVVTAGNGKTALKLFEQQAPDVVLLDLMLPGMNGREIRKIIRETYPATRIIYLSAKAVPTTPAELKEFSSEADAFLAKPATSRQILSAVKKVLGKAGQAS